MALLIQRARQLILKERPTIAVAGNQNMFCDMSRFEDIFHINLQLFLAQDDEDLERKAQEAVQSGADLLIGGNTVIAAAKEAAARGQGAVSVDGKMVDVPVVKRAEYTLIRAGLA